MSPEFDLRDIDRAYDPDPAFVARLRRRLEAASTGAVDEVDTVEAIERVDAIEVTPAPGLDARLRPRRRTALMAAAAIVVVAAVGSMAWVQSDDPGPATFAEVTHPDDVPDVVPDDVPRSGAMWPQSSIDAVREAQERADAGDPAYTWQIEVLLSSQEWWDTCGRPGSRSSSGSSARSWAGTTACSTRTRAPPDPPTG